MIFALPREKKNTPFLISQGYSEIWRCRGFGVGEGGGGVSFIDGDRKLDFSP